MKSLDQIFVQLESSSFRSRFHLRGPDRAYIDQKGLPLILQHAQDSIDKHLAPAHPKNDGKQTRFRGHPVFVAHHATVTCCRSCLSKWHIIPSGREFNDDERAHAEAQILLVAGVCTSNKARGGLRRARTCCCAWPIDEPKYSTA